LPTPYAGVRRQCKVATHGVVRIHFALQVSRRPHRRFCRRRGAPSRGVSSNSKTRTRALG
jgi:hypothetical protein